MSFVCVFLFCIFDSLSIPCTNTRNKFDFQQKKMRDRETCNTNNRIIGRIKKNSIIFQYFFHAKKIKLADNKKNLVIMWWMNKTSSMITADNMI